jgi:hypothetical protein
MTGVRRREGDGTLLRRENPSLPSCHASPLIPLTEKHSILFSCCLACMYVMSVSQDMKIAA